MLTRSPLLAVFCLSMLAPAAALAGGTRCPCIADNSVASYPTEVTQNRGGSTPIKIKGRENQLLMKFDLSNVPKDAQITSATLRIQLANPKFCLRQVGVSTVSTDWIEGTDAANDNHDAVCHAWPGPRTATWAGPNTSICDVIFGNGGSIGTYTFAKPERDNWWAIDIDPRIVAAMRADSFGLVLQDETGIWAPSRGNIMVHSRENDRHGPRISIEWTEPERVSPSPVTDLRIDTADLEDGQILLAYNAGGDDATTGQALGYEIRYLPGKPGKPAPQITASNWNQATLLPRHKTPRPPVAGQPVRVWITGLDAGRSYSFGVLAYDDCGNRSLMIATSPARLPGPTPPPHLQSVTLPTPTAGSPVTVAGKMAVWATDELTKIDPVTGNAMDGDRYTDTGARNGSHTWDGQKHAVKLTAVRGEVVAFNLIVEATAGELTDIRITPTDLKGPRHTAISAGRFDLLRQWYLRAKGLYYPDACPPLTAPLTIPAKDNSVRNQTNQAVYVDLYVPHNIPAGTYNGSIQVASSAGTASVGVELDVLDLDMPDELSFIIELNAYGFATDDIQRFWDMHRLAHRHRVGYNVLSYGHSASVNVGFLPKVKGEGRKATIDDWSEWDRWMGPLLNGSAFADLPRGPVPIPHFYLPFHENYPARIAPHYAKPEFFLDQPKGEDGLFSYEAWKDYVAEHDVDIRNAFDETWHQTGETIARLWRQHLIDQSWTRTEFQIFCNNKHYFRNPGRGATRSTSYARATSLWTLDEPSFGRDFRALAEVYRAFRPHLIGDPLQIACRSDVSRPQWQGDRLDGVSDLAVVSSALYQRQPLIQERRVVHGDRFWFYGGGLGPEQENAALAAVYIKAWTLGTDGGLAYWTSFSSQEGWDKPNRLAIVHLNGGHGWDMPVATTRLKAQRRAQQDIELMTMLASQPGWTRQRVARAVAAAVNLTSETEARHADDPGQTRFKDIHAKDLARIRLAVAREILAARHK